MTSPLTSRRKIVRTAAWAAPAVALATAAPAHASSQPTDPCTPKNVVINWSNTATWSRSADGTSAVATLNPGTADQISMCVTATPVNSMRIGSSTKGNDNFKLTQDAIGGTADRGLTFHQFQASSSPQGRTNRIVYTFSFTDAAGAPITVTNIQFMLADLDSTAGDFWDAVDLSAGFSLVGRGAGIVGSGTPTSPFQNSSENTPYPNESGQGNVTVLYPAASSFAITYWSAVRRFSGVDTDQKIFLSNLSFSYTRVIGC